MKVDNRLTERGYEAMEIRDFINHIFRITLYFSGKEFECEENSDSSQIEDERKFSESLRLFLWDQILRS